MSKLLGAVFALTIFLSANSRANPNLYLMASLGDSISYGFLANTTAGIFAVPGLNLFSIDDIKKWFINRDVFDNRKTYSWTSGLKIRSQYMLLNSYLRRKEPGKWAENMNLSYPGNEAKDLMKQADQVVAAMNSSDSSGRKYRALKYVTILIGANDSCSNQSKAEVRTSLLAVFYRLAQIKQDQPISILVSGLPRIPDLGAPNIANSRTVGGMQCKTLRQDILHECSSLTEWTTSEQHRAKLLEVLNTNMTLRKTVSEGNALLGTKLHIFFNDEIFNRGIDVKNLAVDCFHPNANSHEAISLGLWSYQPFFK